ncbi:MAG TPA: magnesium and cobalt transport protein CorA [Paenibacillaceae bacterium]|nr:magnesium and cobalt transport protein CorA [Paenibacillaceae bacterium]
MLIYKNGEVHHEQHIRLPQDDEVGFIRLLRPSTEEIKHFLGEVFACHPLVIEDCVFLERQRPKVDTYKNHALVMFSSLLEDLAFSKMGIIIGKNYIIAIQLEVIPALDELREQFLKIPEHMEHPGLVLYHLLDQCVDQYMSITDSIEDKVESLETSLYENPTGKLSQEIFHLKRRLHGIRRTFVEERDVLGTLMHTQFPYTREETNLYLMDVHDHLNRVVDSVDSFREALTSILELQVSLKGDRMNEIMKTLTLVSTFFLPLTFIVGLYGTNLRLPEYRWNLGYPYLWLVLIGTTVVMFLYFKRKNWW